MEKLNTGSGDPAPENQTRDPIDRSWLDSLRSLDTDDGKEFLGSIIRSYLKSSPEFVAQLRSSVEQEDAETLWQAAHTLKSSSANLGASRLAEICCDLEELGRQGSTLGARGLLLQLTQEYGSVREALSRELDGC